MRGLERGEDVSHDMLTATEDVEPTGDYVMDEAKHTIAATERGLKKIERRLGIDDIYADLSGQLVNHLQQALKAQYMFHRDKQYVVTNGEVKIVDVNIRRLRIHRGQRGRARTRGEPDLGHHHPAELLPSV